MTKEDILRMAQQAGGRESANPELYDCFIMSLDDLKRFAALVIANNPPQTFMSYQEGCAAGAAAEREACAKVCERQVEDFKASLASVNHMEASTKRFVIEFVEIFSSQCAAAIRGKL